MNRPANQSSTPLRRRLRLSLAVSSVCHLALATGLLLTHFQPWDYAALRAREAKTIQVSWSTQRLQAENAPTQPEMQVVTDPAAATGEMIRQRIDELAAEASGLTAEQQRERLDTLSEKLDRVADSASIDQLATRFQKLLGTAPRATQPAKMNAAAADQAAADFDFDTAQIHDVQRAALADGGWRYWVVLLDAQGRTLDSELDAAAGEQLFLTFQQIKSNPLLEKVYRQIAMPLFDQMLSGMKARAASDSTRPSGQPPVKIPVAEQTAAESPGEAENPFDDRRAVDFDAPPSAKQPAGD